jgi:hypothetical protein
MNILLVQFHFQIPLRYLIHRDLGTHKQALERKCTVVPRRQTAGDMIAVLTNDEGLKAYRKLTKQYAAHFHSRVGKAHSLDPPPAPRTSVALVRSSKLHETLIGK